MILACHLCKYKWDYRGEKKPQEYPQYVTCPRCRSNVKLPTVAGNEAKK